MQPPATTPTVDTPHQGCTHHLHPQQHHYGHPMPPPPQMMHHHHHHHGPPPPPPKPGSWAARATSFPAKKDVTPTTTADKTNDVAPVAQATAVATATAVASNEEKRAQYQKPKKKKGKRRVSKKNKLVPLSDTTTMGDLDAEQKVLYSESCEVLPEGLPFKVRDFRSQIIKKTLLFRQKVEVTVKDTTLLDKEVKAIRKEMLKRGEPELGEYAYIILAQTVKDKEHTIVLCMCPTVPRGNRPSQSVEMLSYGDDITCNATYKVLEVLGREIPNHGNNYGGPEGIQHFINLNLRRICSAVVSAFRRRSAATNSDDDSDDDSDDSTYIPDSDDDDDDDSCCSSDEEEAESLGVFLRMVHDASKKLGGKGVVVLDASGVSSKTNKYLWKGNFGDMRIVKGMYHPSMYVYGRGNFEKTFANASKNCQVVSAAVREIFQREDDNSSCGRFFENCADRKDFFMVGRGDFNKQKFHHEMGKMGAAALLRNLRENGVNVADYFSELGKKGYQGFSKNFEEEGTSVSEYFSNLGRRSFACLLMKLEEKKMSVSEYFSELSKKRLEKCSAENCDNLVLKAGRGLCHLHDPTRGRCSNDGCPNNAVKGGVCKKHGAKVARPAVPRCSHDGCPNIAVKGGVCKKHGAKVVSPRCSHDGCPNNAVRGGVCKKHGAKVVSPLCSHDGCPNIAVKGGVCKKHGAKVALCSHDGCPNIAVKGGVCIKHGAKVARPLCSHDGCPNNAVKGGVCIKHGAKVARPLCSHDGCPNFARKGGVCRKHGAKAPLHSIMEGCSTIAPQGGAFEDRKRQAVKDDGREAKKR